jgi:hypothetical protein
MYLSLSFITSVYHTAEPPLICRGNARSIDIPEKFQE